MIRSGSFHTVLVDTTVFVATTVVYTVEVGTGTPKQTQPWDNAELLNPLKGPGVAARLTGALTVTVDP